MTEKDAYHFQKPLPTEVDELDAWGLRKEKFEYYRPKPYYIEVEDDEELKKELQAKEDIL